VGLETGDDEILKLVRKGVTSAERSKAGRKPWRRIPAFRVLDAQLGRPGRWRQHAENTARVLNEIDPHYIRSRPFVPRQGTEIFDDYASGACIFRRRTSAAGASGDD
jgi:radical SAM superfamily enzyme YgiQ (UPF0313 family)